MSIFKYINVPPTRILGLIVFLAVMIGFIIWVSGFRKKTREILKNKNTFFMISGVVLLICLVALVKPGLNMGLDFTGGTVVELAVNPNVTAKDVRSAIDEFAKTSKNPDAFADPKVQMALEIEDKTGAPAASPVTPETPDQPKQPLDTPTQPPVQPDQPEKPMDTPAQPPIQPDQPMDTPAQPPVQPDQPEQPMDTPAQPENSAPESAAPDAAPGNVPGVVQESGVQNETAENTDSSKFRRCFIQLKKGATEEEVAQMITFLKGKIGNLEEMKTEHIGPTIGQELKRKAVTALLIALIAQLIYITFRFGSQIRYGIAADIALIHDLIIMVGLYTLLGKPIDSAFLAALLTIIGYSVMDSVVVFDRIRENLKTRSSKTYEEVVNLSLNQVMTRTAATSFTTILTLFAIYYFGGATLRNFSLALLIGAVAGTYSSLFIASPLVVMFDNMAKDRQQKEKEERRARLEEEARKKSEKKTYEKAPTTSDKKEKSEDSSSEAKVENEEQEEPKRRKSARKRRR